jgi:hypothetical protein
MPPLRATAGFVVVTEYLERAAHFQNLAEAETDLKLKEQLMDQVTAYLKLANKPLALGNQATQ